MHFDALNPHISLAGTPFVIPTATTPWPGHRGGAPRRCQLVRLVGHQRPPDRGRGAGAGARRAPPARRPARSVLAISARSEAARRALAAGLRRTAGDAATRPELADLCATAGRRRSHHSHRLAVVGRHAGRAGRRARRPTWPARSTGRGRRRRHRPARPARVRLPGPGRPVGRDGPPAAGDGARLPRRHRAVRGRPSPRTSTGRCSTSWPATAPRLDDIDVVQPALFAVQVGLAARVADLRRHAGRRGRPQHGRGGRRPRRRHPDLDDAARIICRRSALLRRIGGHAAPWPSWTSSVDDARRAIAGHEDRLAIAVSNSPARRCCRATRPPSTR